MISNKADNAGNIMSKILTDLFAGSNAEISIC